MLGIFNCFVDSILAGLKILTVSGGLQLVITPFTNKPFTGLLYSSGLLSKEYSVSAHDGPLHWVHGLLVH
jgi:hypothetical protein